MSSSDRNLSSIGTSGIHNAASRKIGIVTAEWNQKVTDKLYEGCLNTLLEQGVEVENIFSIKVPGSFELPAGAQFLMENKAVDSVICLGAVVKGETRHDEYINHAVAKGIMDLNLHYQRPIIFGVLTPENQAQAEDRAGGNHGNKGVEAAITALTMLSLGEQLT